MFIYRNVLQLKTVVKPDITRDKGRLLKIFIAKLFHDICEEQFAIYASVPK